VRYPAYPIQRTQPVFSSRTQVLEYEQALAAAAAVDAALEVRAGGELAGRAGLPWTRVCEYVVWCAAAAAVASALEVHK
jgi:hypothetical protein